MVVKKLPSLSNNWNLSSKVNHPLDRRRRHMLVLTLIARTTLLSPSTGATPLSNSSDQPPPLHTTVSLSVSRGAVLLLVPLPWVIPIFLRRPSPPFAVLLGYNIQEGGAAGTVRRIPTRHGQWPRSLQGQARVLLWNMEKRVQSGHGSKGREIARGAFPYFSFPLSAFFLRGEKVVDGNDIQRGF